MSEPSKEAVEAAIDDASTSAGYIQQAAMVRLADMTRTLRAENERLREEESDAKSMLGDVAEKFGRAESQRRTLRTQRDELAAALRRCCAELAMRDAGVGAPSGEAEQRGNEAIATLEPEDE